MSCVAVCCSVLQCVAVCCTASCNAVQGVTLCVPYPVLQGVAVCCSVLQCVSTPTLHVPCPVFQGDKSCGARHKAKYEICRLLQATEWLRLVGSLQLQVSFAKEPYKRNKILQKKTYNFKEPTLRRHPIECQVCRLWQGVVSQSLFCEVLSHVVHGVTSSGVLCRPKMEHRT